MAALSIATAQFGTLLFTGVILENGPLVTQLRPILD